MGIVCVNYSTDDPWNPALRASWHLRALPEYDAVFTTRRANIGSFAEIGLRRGATICLSATTSGSFGRHEPIRGRPAPDVLFVGGADRDRVAFMTEFLPTGPRVALVGSYWERFPAMRPYTLGQQPPEALCALTAAAKVNLCLVRRANRDGHVMRSFEIAALGGCMLAEDTAEHREIFGEDGEAVVYFRSPREAAERARALLADPAERARLSAAVRARISGGAHTYRDRLVSILEARLVSAGRTTSPARAPAGDATAQNCDRDRRAVSCPRSRTRAACARPSCKILFLRSAGAGAALRAPRRMPCVALAARSTGGRVAATDAAPYAEDARTCALRVAEPRCHDAAASLRRLHLHVRHLSGGRTFREGALWRDHMARTGEPPYPVAGRDPRVDPRRGAAEPACHTARACRLCARGPGRYSITPRGGEFSSGRIHLRQAVLQPLWRRSRDVSACAEKGYRASRFRFSLSGPGVFGKAATFWLGR